MTTLKKVITLLLTVTVLLALFAFGAIAADAVTVDIVSFSRGAQTNLRSSELLEAKVEGYDGNVRDLTYKWTSTIKTYLYVYNNHNMYGINNTDGEIEIYNRNSDSASENMAGRSYKDSFSGTGYAWAAIYGADISKKDLVGKITVQVYDQDGNLLASDTHEGKKSGASYIGLVVSDFADDISHVRFGLFEGDTKNVKILLGESSIVHITCVECSISQPTITKGEDIIALEVDTDSQEWHIKSVKGTSYGDAKVQVTIKKGNCKFHKNLTVTREIEVFVYKKPTTTSTATAVLLDNLDDHCTYYIGGVKGERKTVDGKEYVVFENLTPNTQYQVEVVGQAAETEPVYAYVYETTKPAHVGTVKVLLDGTYDTSTATATGTPVNIEAMMPEVETLYLRYEDSEIYFPLTNTETGVYSSELSDGNYTLYYSVAGSEEKVQLGDQILTINGASRTRDVFFNSVNYDEDGGVPTIDTEYHLSNTKVTVSKVVPAKEGFLFSHWSCEDGHVHKAGDVLTNNISKQYNLVAQYVDANNVYVDIVINHTSADGDSINNDRGMHDISFTVDQRFGGEGNYTELVQKTVDWDGNSNFSDQNFIATYSANTTTYISRYPFLTNVAKDAEYTITAPKTGYDLVSVTSMLDGNGDWRLTATLQYNPNDYDLEFSVELDEKSKNVSADLKPKAVNVKVLAWSDPIDVLGEDVMWWHIIQHHDTYLRVELDENGYGEGTYPVWTATTDTHTPYSYRIEVVSFETADGTILPATDKVGEDKVYATEFDRYSAEIFVEGGNTPSGSTLDGVYYDGTAQAGTLKAVVTIDVYDVTFVPNGGELLGTTDNTVLNYQVGIPNLEKYVPTRAGGYVFDGWYIADENGNMTEEIPVSGTIIYNNTTLIAKWIEPLTVKGQIIVAGTYTVEENGVEIVYHIKEFDRLDTVTVLLQHIGGNGYAETIQYVNVPLVYDETYGYASYEFSGLENHGHDYRIKVSMPDYHSHYNNDASGVAFTEYKSYAEDSEANWYLAAYVDDADVNDANVYAYLHFQPESFELKYEVNSSYIGEAFAPTDAEVLVLYNTGAHIDPQHWDTISQMVVGDKLVGNVSKFVNDFARGSESVWQSQSATGAAYEYSIRVEKLTMLGQNLPYNNYDWPFYIAYNGSARYSDVNDAQTQLLTATLIPKMYTLTFDMGNLPEGTEIGDMDAFEAENDTYATSFYWSHGAEITAVPKAQGFTFLGWFDADGNKVSVIPADTAENVTVTAKWSANITFDILADAGYYAQKRDSAEKIGVIAFNAKINDIDTVKNIITAFGIFVYDKTGSSVKVSAENADMDQLVTDNGEFHILISNISIDNFDSSVMAIPYVVVNGEIITGDSMSTSVSQTQKWLGANTAE